MIQRLGVLILLAILFPGVIIVTAQEIVELQTEVSIQSPLPGQAIRGNVPILVDTTTMGFLSAELSFGYDNDPSGTWFLVDQSQEPNQGEVMTEWDTTTLTDGSYVLRLVVSLSDGNQYTTFVQALRVRNYSPIETDTPSPSATSAPLATPLPSITPSSTATLILPTPTLFPPNPLQVTRQDIWANLLRGAAGGFAAVVLTGLYISLRKRFRK
jgi:hypothetical protein